jgi:class 3 adenylate cyclase
MEPSSVKRRLTCILAADAVGYSKQMGQDEEGTIHVLQAHRSVIDGIIAFHHGRIVSTAGDSVLAEFSSAVEAVRCAVEIQDALKTRNDSLPEHRKMLFRVGVNLGDVVINHDDILGDGVNVAARLESMAEPGGICIASSVYDQITGKLDLGFQDIGQQNLKNISRPIHVYRVSGTVPPILVPHLATPAVATPVPAPRNPLPWVVGSLLALAAGVFVASQAGWVHFGATKPTAVDNAVVAAPAPAVVASVAPAVAPVPSALPKSTPASAVTAQAKLPEPVSQRTVPDAKPVKRQAEPEPSQTNATQRVPTAAPPVVPAVVPAATAADIARFNGRWSVHVDCAKHEDGALGYKLDFVAEVKDGWLRGEAGKPDNPGWLLLQGDIQADGRSVLQAKGLTADPRLSVKGVRQGTPYAYQVDARFDGNQGTGRRVQLRACLLGFTKQ